jgi:hypothetical protein
MAMFTLYGGLGQYAVHRWEDWRAGPTAADPEKAQKESWFARYSPLKRLTDEEYTDVMRGRIHKVDTEIVALDEKIAQAEAAVREEKDASKGSGKR